MVAAARCGAVNTASATRFGPNTEKFEVEVWLAQQSSRTRGRSKEAEQAAANCLSCTRNRLHQLEARLSIETSTLEVAEQPVSEARHRESPHSSVLDTPNPARHGLLALFGTTFIVRPSKIPSQSMEPTLLVGVTFS
jgi:hypothetical protein